MKTKLMLLNSADNQFQLKIKSECTADDFSKKVLEFKLSYNKALHKLIIKPISKLHFTQSELDILTSIVDGNNKELLNSLNSIANKASDCDNLDHFECYYMICDYDGDIRYVK